MAPMNKRISDHRKFEKDPEELKKERQRARERMRYVKPKIAGKVLAHHRYWSVQFLELYLERCDETAFDIPADAYLLAQQAPEMARRIRVGPGAGEFDSPLDKMSGIVLALAVKGSCCRAADEVAEAELCFRRAFEGLGRHEASPIVMAELHRRYAALLLLAGSAKVEDHIEQSLDFARAASFRPAVADALALRGIVAGEKRPAVAVQDFLEATRLADLRSPRGNRTAKASLQNVATAIAYGSVALKDQETALRFLTRLKEDLKGTPTSSRKLKVLWIEGLLLGNLRIERHAKRQVKKARKGLWGLGDIPSFITVSVDLIWLLTMFGESDEAREVALDTATRIEAADTAPALLAMLKRWIEEAPSNDSVRAARGLAMSL